MVRGFTCGLGTGALLLALSLGGGPSAAGESLTGLATPGSPVDRAGRTILSFVGGRSLEDAGGAGFNPFGINGETLLFTAGAFFFSPDLRMGQELREGELSIFPQYRTPGGAFVPSAAQSPVIPFAFKQAGACYAGYVGGYPVADTVYEVDLTGEVCHAATVDDILYASYDLAVAQSVPAETPNTGNPTSADPVPAVFNAALPGDGDLELVVWTAYNAAYNRAILRPDYLFFTGSDYQAVHDAIAAELARAGLQDVVVAGVPATDFAATRACGWSGQTELRVAFSADGAGIAVAAVSARRAYGYEYDPGTSPDLVIVGPRDCATSGFGRAPAAGAG